MDVKPAFFSRKIIKNERQNSEKPARIANFAMQAVKEEINKSWSSPAGGGLPTLGFDTYVSDSVE